jgi:hypothetical protein
MEQRPGRPRGVAVVAAVNAAGVRLTLAFWALVFVRIFAAGAPPSHLDAGSISATFGFMVGDLTWAVALQAAGAIGLWRMRA